ncbi:TonB-dependent receptor plug domain-containing protein [Ancylomarina sp. YFZ004]
MSFEELLNQNVVTASKYEQSLSEAPSSITIVTSDDIRDYGYNTLDEALNSQKGFYISNDRNYSYIGTRGFGRSGDYNNRSKLLINGHTLNENVFGSASFGSALSFNMDLIDRIEIVRGPGSSMYGSGAMLSVINIITKKGHDIDGLDIKTTLGSYNKKEASALWGKTLENGIDIVISGIAGQTDGPDLYFEDLDTPETNHGISNGLDWEKLYGLYSEISKGNLTIKASLSNRRKGIPTGAWETDLINTSKSLDLRYYFDLQYKKEFNKKLSFLLRSYYDSDNYKGKYSYESYKSYDKSNSNWLGTEAQFIYNINKKNKFSGGVGYKYNSEASYKEWDLDETYMDKNKPYSEFSIYVQDEYKVLPNLRLTAGLRFDYHSFGTNSFSPRLAAIYNITKKSTLKLLYCEAYRTPSFYETQYEENGYLKANSNIDPERIRTTEVVWEYNPLNNLFISTALYQYKMRKLIDQTLDEEDGLVYFQNIGRVSGKGLEFEIKYKPQNKTTLFVNGALQKSIDSNSKTKLTNSPKLLLKAGVIQSVTDLFTISPECFFESKRKTIYKTSTDPFFLANLNIRSKMLFNHVMVNFKIRNIFDTEYAYPGGYEHAQHSIIQNGRNFSFGLKVHL